MEARNRSYTTETDILDWALKNQQINQQNTCLIFILSKENIARIAGVF